MAAMYILSEPTAEKLYCVICNNHANLYAFNPIQNGLFQCCFLMGGAKKTPFPKICHSYSTIMKLGTVIPYLKKIQKNINHVTHPLRPADISIFFTEN